MKSLRVTIASSILLGGLVYVGLFHWKKARIDQRHAHLTSFEWFCREFHVYGEARDRIASLHQIYFPECEEHCIHYAGTRDVLAAALQDPTLDEDPEHIDAMHRLAHLEKEADKRFIDFIYQVAGEMIPTESSRYRKRMKGWIEHAGRPRDVQRHGNATAKR